VTARHSLNPRENRRTRAPRLNHAALAVRAEVLRKQRCVDNAAFNQELQCGGMQRT
jgi:hypothetical protein